MVKLPMKTGTILMTKTAKTRVMLKLTRRSRSSARVPSVKLSSSNVDLMG